MSRQVVLKLVSPQPLTTSLMQVRLRVSLETQEPVPDAMPDAMPDASPAITQGARRDVCLLLSRFQPPSSSLRNHMQELEKLVFHALVNVPRSICA